MTKDFQPQHTVTENPYGNIAYGPMSTEEDDDGTRYVQTIAGDHITWANKNGNKTTITPGTSGEICGTELVKGKNSIESHFNIFAAFNTSCLFCSAVLKTLPVTPSVDIVFVIHTYTIKSPFNLCFINVPPHPNSISSGCAPIAIIVFMN